MEEGGCSGFILCVSKFDKNNADKIMTIDRQKIVKILLYKVAARHCSLNNEENASGSHLFHIKI